MKVIFLALLLTGAATGAFAQTDFSGRWILDKEISADLARASFEPQTQQRRNATFSGGGFGRGGFGGRRTAATPAAGTARPSHQRSAPG